MKNTAPMSLNQLKKKSPAPAVTKAVPQQSEVRLYPVENMQFLLFNGNDMISRQLRNGQAWESTLVEILKHFLTNLTEPVVLDIGANLGSITVPVGLFIKNQKGKVISFEAQRGVYYQLCGNIFANQLSQVCIAHLTAIGNHEGTIDVPVLDLAHETNVGALSLDQEIRKQQKLISSEITEFESIPLKPIDYFNFQRIDMVKIDVEGLEFEVLQGASETLKRTGYPPLFFEVWGDYMKDQIPKRNELMKFVHEKLGYQTVTYGELCIAQHPENKYFEISLKNKSLDMLRLK